MTELLNVRITSLVPDENPILAFLGIKHENASFGVGTSFEAMTKEEAIQSYREFMSRHQGEDWVLKATPVGKRTSVIIK